MATLINTSMPLIVLLGLLALAGAALLAWHWPAVEGRLLSWLMRRRGAREARHRPQPRVAMRGRR